MRWGSAKFSFCLAALPLLGGCVFRTIGDLAFVSIEAVDRYDYREIPTPSAAGLTEFLSDSEIVRYGLGNPYEGPRHEVLLKVEFSTATNLARYAREEGYFLANTAFFCNRPDDFVLMSYSYIFWHRVLLGRGDDPIEAIDTPGQPITYYAFLNVAREAVKPSSLHEVSFNLRTEFENVCLYVRGANIPFGFKSNVITIPKQGIAEALSGTPQQNGASRLRQ